MRQICVFYTSIILWKELNKSLLHKQYDVQNRDPPTESLTWVGGSKMQPFLLLDHMHHQSVNDDNSEEKNLILC